ncbi:hypothetical protein DYB28_000415 [Aphanomyces astaci]|uniref:Uncharacterized protein n=2 Tax=Aphanomyces astaci TaxID=112090 RepID=A0A9X8E2F8_APHAT|nr:hypothetical protein DYB28_000415 [Aphanomyces astaci]
MVLVEHFAARFLVAINMPRVTNFVDDIEGSKPCMKPYVYFHKPPTVSVDGSTSKRLHPGIWNKGENPQFMQLPIEGSSPSHTGFTTNRIVNPLTPSYKLPHCEPAPLIYPKFLRDSYQTADIDGTRAAPRHTLPPRDTMNLNDIAGATAAWRPRGVKTSKLKDNMQVTDIIHAGFKSQRVTDVLRPVHVVNGFRSADDPLSFPRAPYEATKHPFYPLETHDIQGANPADSLKGIVGNIPHVKRRHFRSTNNVQDIRGAQANTVHHSIVSNRHVDPIFPAYTDLDGDSLETGLPVPKNVQFPDVAPRVSERKSNNVSTIQLGMKPPKDQRKPPPTAVGVGAKHQAARKADIEAVRGLK